MDGSMSKELTALVALECAYRASSGPTCCCGLPATSVTKHNALACDNHCGIDGVALECAEQVRKMMAIYRSNMPL